VSTGGSLRITMEEPTHIVSPIGVEVGEPEEAEGDVTKTCVPL